MGEIVRGEIVQLEPFRRRRAAYVRSPVGRLEAAVDRLDGIVRRGATAIDPRVETEMLAISGSVAIGRYSDAAFRAERLASRLEGRNAGRSPARSPSAR
jgi:hypothetical protein